MKAERTVGDTNVLISAAIVQTGKPRQVLEQIRRDGRLLMCPDGMLELSSRLLRPKFDRYLTQSGRRAFLESLSSIVEIVKISGTLRVCRDPDDDKILETALVGAADCLVTGDRDLLALRPVGDANAAIRVEDALYRGVAIIRSAEFLLLMETGQG